MKVEKKEQVKLTHGEYLSIINALDTLCDMARDSYINATVNSQLPCGFSVEDIRDGLQYITDIVEIE